MAQAAPPTCEVNRPVVFAGLDYESASFHTAVAQTIIRLGYGCAVDRVPGATVALVNGLARGDADVIMEIWLANPVEAWVRAQERGQVVALGTTFPDAAEGWFVPRYLVQGEGARAPTLKSVTDLPRYAGLFQDPDEPSKGRFLNCVAGWQCEIVNSKKLIAYGLEATFTNTRAGSGEAMVAAVDSAIKRRRPIVFYYWGPSWLLGAHDLVKLEEPPFDQTIWDAMLKAERPTAATGYPISKVVIGANARFVAAAPRLAEFLRNYGMTSALTSEMLAKARDKTISPEDMATEFLKTRKDLWQAWVPADVVKRVADAL
jgi:glycine betaine/proline transport system substrate-binding protein